VLVKVVVIAIVAAILVWVLSMIGAPSIVGTIVWILALLAIVLVLLQLVQGGGVGAGGGAGRRRPRA
jgi:hypothetical protein